MTAIAAACLVSVLLVHVFAALPEKARIEKNGPSEKSLQERGLITTSPKIKDVIREQQAYTLSEAAVKHTNGTVLAYVTPWNRKGYDIARLFAMKFTHICPVWLQLKMNEDQQVRFSLSYFVPVTH